MKMGIVVVELCQINRAGVKGNEGRFCNLEDLRGSGTIEQDANSAIFVENRRTEDSKELRGEDAYQDTAVMYAKNREGRRALCPCDGSPNTINGSPPLKRILKKSTR
ncbi:DnaB helicase C-terminal domain-containing protein [Gemmiger formicilis]|nr:DnaB helicase C-terminal domain-containing protein [Gemmiger formicilis]